MLETVVSPCTRWTKTAYSFVCFRKKDDMYSDCFLEEKNTILNMYNAWKKFKIISYFQNNVEPWESLNVMISKHKSIFSAYQLDINIHIHILNTYLQPTDSIHQNSRCFSKAIKIHGSKYKYLLAYIICLAAENEFRFIQVMRNVRKTDDSHMNEL